jgi:TPR repeat protein
MNTDRAVLLRYRRGDEARRGSGLRVGRRFVLTADHCADGSDHRVVLGGQELPATVVVRTHVSAVDLAILEAPDLLEVDPLKCALVDRTVAALVRDCQALGFPRWKDAEGHSPQLAQADGNVPTAEGYRPDAAPDAPSFMSFKITTPLIQDVPVLAGELDQPGSQWAGMSGAVVTSGDGLILGVIRSHAPAEGVGSLTVTPLEALSELPTETAATFWAALAVADPRSLPSVPPTPGAITEPLAGLVEVLDEGQLPRMADLDPYRLRVAKSDYGDHDSHGLRDPYVPRTRNDVDSRLRAALVPGRFVLVAGPSKSGKTRTAFEAARECWPEAHLLAPTPGSLDKILSHPRVGDSGGELLVWLDDLDRYLTGTGTLTPTLLTALISRPGVTLVLATLRDERWEALRADTGELSADIRAILDSAHTIELQSTAEDSIEQAAAQHSYPKEALDGIGLAERLAYAPDLLLAYRHSASADPARHLVIRVAVDWARVGMKRPIPEPDLKSLTVAAVKDERPDLDITDDVLTSAIAEARKVLPGSRNAAMLITHHSAEGVRAYRAFDYLVANDNGQDGHPRAIPDPFWDESLRYAEGDDAIAMGDAAYYADRTTIAITLLGPAAAAGDSESMRKMGWLMGNESDPPDIVGSRNWLEQAIATGSTRAMINLGDLLANKLTPPDLDGARVWYQRAADTGDADAMVKLGNLLVDKLDSPELVGAQRWYTRAANAGSSLAMSNLGRLLAYKLNPPDLDGARLWYERAAEAGYSDAMVKLGNLLSDELKPPDLDRARLWYERAADAGDSDAMVNLGNLLSDKLKPPDLDGARLWYERAANAGDSDAMFNLGILLADQLDTPDVEGAQRWYERAAEAGDSDAMVNLGNLLSDELKPPDLDGARLWYERAADAGDSDAMLNLGILLADQLTPPELDGARLWYERAAAAGDSDAAVRLSDLLPNKQKPPISKVSE